jgi:6-phosphogluconolactonase (cycloisomerase 2 family)
MHASPRRNPTRGRAGTGLTALVLAGSIAGLLALPGAAAAQHGVLTQRPDAAGCISHDGSDGCTDADLLFGAFALTISVDGRHAYVAAIDSRAVAALARDKRTGALSQLPSPMGCISQTGHGGTCATGKGLHAPLAATITPDGKHVYVVSQQRDPITLSALALFARDQSTGALTQLPGADGCISEDPGAGACTPGIGLRGAAAVAVSPDGRHVYVASQIDAVAVFARNDATGALTQLPEPYGCISQSGNGGRCTQGRALDGARSLVVSKDGRFVYVASELSRAVAVLARDRRTGALSQLAGEAGCVANDGSIEMCTQAVGLGGPTSLALGRNGKFAYVVSAVSDELAVLARDRKTGTLASVHCVKDDGSIMCEPAVALRQPYSVTVSPDSKHVYVAARDSDAVAVFAQERQSGSLRQLATPSGCVSDDGTEGLCSDGRALRDPRSVSVSRDGRHVYAATQGSAAVAVLQRRR